MMQRFMHAKSHNGEMQDLCLNSHESNKIDNYAVMSQWNITCDSIDKVTRLTFPDVPA
jgi:hypothetical protein